MFLNEFTHQGRNEILEDQTMWVETRWCADHEAASGHTGFGGGKEKTGGGGAQIIKVVVVCRS